MNVADRIEHASEYSSISLTNAEAELYEHAGYRMAHFEDGQLIEFFDPMDFTNPVHALTEAITWLNHKTGETWLVLCSGYTLCEPERLLANDEASLAHLAKIIHQAFADCCH